MEASIYFLGRDKLYETEKPYSLRFPPDGDHPQSNIRREKFKVTINDMRKGEPPALESNGFQVMELQSAMDYEDFANEDMIQSVYLPELQTSLMETLGAKYVNVTDFAVSFDFGL